MIMLATIFSGITAALMIWMSIFVCMKKGRTERMQIRKVELPDELKEQIEKAIREIDEDEND